MSKLKTSVTAKNNFSRYETEGCAGKNKKSKLSKHAKLHPNDIQSQARKTSACSGRSHEKRTQFEASISRQVAHHQLFEQEGIHRVKGRDLSSSSARKAFLNSLKITPSSKKKTA